MAFVLVDRVAVPAPPRLPRSVRYPAPGSALIDLLRSSGLAILANVSLFAALWFGLVAPARSPTDQLVALKVIALLPSMATGQDPASDTQGAESAASVRNEKITPVAASEAEPRAAEATSEWSQSRIRVPTEQVAHQAERSAAAAPSQGSGSIGQGATGGGGYDPYAGSAPMRPEDLIARGVRLAEPAALSSLFPQPVLQSIGAQMAERWPQDEGRVTVVIYLSALGQVDRIQIQNGNLSANAQQFLLQALRANAKPISSSVAATPLVRTVQIG